MTRQCWLRCIGDGSCGEDLPVTIERNALAFAPNHFRVTRHPTFCKSCGWRDDMQPFPEYPQGELYAAFAEGEDV